MADRYTVGVGWVEASSGSFVPGVREEVLNIAAGLDAPCLMLRSDTLEPPISPLEFQSSGDPQSAQCAANRCDLLVLSGHGGGSSVGFKLPGDDALRPKTASGPGVQFGDKLRCVLLIACGIFEQELDNPDAWAHAFDGLHLLIASPDFVNPLPGRGARFAANLKSGYSFIEAWDLACREAGATETWEAMVPADGDAPYDPFWKERPGKPVESLPTKPTKFLRVPFHWRPEWE